MIVNDFFCTKLRSMLCRKKVPSLVLIAFLQLKPYSQRRPSLEFQLKRLKTERFFAGSISARMNIFEGLLVRVNRSKLYS